MGNPRDFKDPKQRFLCKRVMEWIKEKDATILIAAGGLREKYLFSLMGFKNVTITNIDTGIDVDKYAPFKWEHANVEDLPYENESFDYVVAHDALHHCRSPHRALLEMYRVAAKGLFYIESYDSVFVRLMAKLGIGQNYETAAVYYNEGKQGGVENTHIPNFIYRWREREVIKTIQSYAPYRQHEFAFRFNPYLSMGLVRRKRGNIIKKLLKGVIGQSYLVFARLFPRFSNQFAVYVGKPDLEQNIYPWIKLEGKELLFNMEWGKKRFLKKIYKRKEDL